MDFLTLECALRVKCVDWNTIAASITCLVRHVGNLLDVWIRVLQSLHISVNVVISSESPSAYRVHTTITRRFS